MDSQKDPADQPEDATPADDFVQGGDEATQVDDDLADDDDEPTEPGASDTPPASDPGDRPLKDVLSGFEFAHRDYLAGLSDMIAKSLGPSLGGLEALGRQQASWAKTFPVPDYSTMLPKFELPKFEPYRDIAKYDVSAVKFSGLDAVARQVSESVLTGFDLGKFLPKIDFRDLFKFEPAGGWDKWWANWWPPNWSRDIDQDVMQAILNDEGLPLVWVPRAEIVAEVLTAASREERVAVLIRRRVEVAADCLAVLGEIEHPRLASQRRLLARAVKALAAGHDEAAQSLAVLVTETAVLQAGAAGHIDGLANAKGLYARVKDAVRVNLGEAPVWLLRVAASLAPVAGFFTPFYPHKGDLVPEGMSRHVTVHFAFDEHYTEEHAVVAVLLMASVVRGLQQGWEIWEPQPNAPESGNENGPGVS